MKKILLAFDGTNFSKGAFEFARKMNELSPVFLTAAFLPQNRLANLWSYADTGRSADFIPLMENEESDEVKQNITQFETLCRTNKIAYRIHKDYYDFAVPELEKESVFADLLILGTEVFYERAGTTKPNAYLTEVLHGMKCPVILVPEEFDFPKSILLAYNGTEDSVYAIKQFAYLFPELTDRETLLIYANKSTEREFPEKLQIQELVTSHFSNLTFYKLTLDTKEYFNTWIVDKKSAILVSGAYGRSGISRLFSKSFITNIIADHQVPVFVAHR